MAETNSIFNAEVVGKRNFAALDDIYTTDARILPPEGPMVTGREGIRGFWSALVQKANGKAVVLESLDVIPAGEGVLEIGKAHLTLGIEGQGDVRMELKYVVYWRQEDGRWKWHVDIWNRNACGGPGDRGRRGQARSRYGVT